MHDNSPRRGATPGRAGDGAEEPESGRLADLLFEANMLKKLPRSGFYFLGAGKESVAEHVFVTTFIAYVMAEMAPEADALRLITMCLLHDLAEARTSDLNYVNKQYVSPDETAALKHAVLDLPFAGAVLKFAEEFRDGNSLEARLARDADQLSLILELKALSDIGYRPPDKWLPNVIGRLKTSVGRSLSDQIMAAEWDAWWLKNYIDTTRPND